VVPTPEPQPEEAPWPDQAPHGALWQAVAQAPWPHAAEPQVDAPPGEARPGEPAPMPGRVSEPSPSERSRPETPFQAAVTQASPLPESVMQETPGQDESGGEASPEDASFEAQAAEQEAPHELAAAEAVPRESAAPAEPAALAATDAGAESSPAPAVESTPAPARAASPAPADRSARILFAAAAVLLALLLPVQAAFHFREAIAARWPAASPLIHQACRALGCAVGAPREVADLAIQASDLQADPAHQGLLILTATIRNRGAVPLAYPYLELTLTDAQDQVVVRRALTPVEYVGGTVDLSRGIPANSDLSVKLFIDASATTQVGYRLFLFYG
jgi:hypothetical protein